MSKDRINNPVIKSWTHTSDALNEVDIITNPDLAEAIFAILDSVQW
jgi:hypothetical protein